MTGFGTDWFDYDNDGWLDLFVANGAVNIIEAQRGQPFPFRMPNQLFHNIGRTVSRTTSRDGGPAFAHAGDRPWRRLRRHRQRRRHRHRGHEQRRARQPAAQPVGSEEPLAADQRASGPGQPVRVRRVGRCRARRATPTYDVASRADGRELSVGQRRARPCRPGRVRVCRLRVVVQWPDGQRERWTGVAVDRLVTLQRGTGVSGAK